MVKVLQKSISDRKWIALVLVFGAFLRLWGTFDIPTYIEDEAIHIPSAISIGNYGTTVKLNGVHPLLSGWILYATISMLGDNPYGWRISNIVFGTASAGLTYLIGGLLFPATAVPVLAAALLAFDPYHSYCSRTTFMEIPASFFFLLFLYLMLLYSERRRPTLPWAGIALGLTVSTKAYFVLAIPVVVLYAFYRARDDGEKISTRCFDFVVALVFLPMAVYLLSYLPWFGRGYSFLEFLQLKLDMYTVMQNYTMETFINPWYVEANGKPWEWFLKPVIHGFELFSDGQRGRFLLQINNFPFRLLLLPSLITLFVAAWRQRAVKELLLPLLVFSCYFLVLVVKRPIFGHSALVILPFAYLAVARAVVYLAQGSRKENSLYGSFFAASFLWGMYTFPLISARLVPLSLYRPILAIATLWGP